MKQLLAFFCLLLVQIEAMAQDFKISGKITDAISHTPLAGASVVIKSTGSGTSTNDDGSFTLSLKSNKEVTLVISYIGYSDVERKAKPGDAIEIALTPSTKIGEEVVVTASKRLEKITNAPATISVITQKDLSQSASFNIGELASKIQGVEFVRTGVNGVGFNARGFNNAFNAKILQMTDGRNSMMAGGSGLPSGIMNTTIKEDVDRVEIVLGPNSALYGPNAHNGILNTITKDPRKYQGTDIVLSGGNQEMFSGRLRTGVKINDKWAFKITGEYTTGKDFEFYDSIYAGGGVFGPAVAIPEKIPSLDFRHIRGEAHLYYNITPKITVIGSYGISTNRFLSVNNTGRNQIRDWQLSFAQLRYIMPHLFVQIYESWTNVGTSYGIPGYTRDFWNRTHSTITDPANPLYPTAGFLYPDEAEEYALRLGNRFKEKSSRFNGEAQYNYDFKNIGLNVVAGFNYQLDNPNTYGTSLIDMNETFDITQYGGALQLEKTLPAKFKFVAAARLDHHSLFDNMFSPKLALVKEIAGGSFRVTWGKAFAAPIILFQRANVFGIVFGNGDGVHYIPNGANVNDPNAVMVTKPLQPEEINTWEAGYKGNIGEKLYVDINGYYGQTKNFLSPAITVGGRALSVGDIPIPFLLVPGTVDNNGILSGGAFSTYFNYGDVASYGIDVGINYYFTDNISLAVKYSWFDSDITENNIKNDANQDGYVSLEERCLNASKNRIAATLSLQNLFKGRVFVNLSTRWVEQYDMYSGNQINTEAGAGKRGVVYGGINPLTNQPRYYLKNFDWGPLGGFTTFDLSAGYKITSMLSLNAGISNIFDVHQLEFVGSPSIGRLFSVELHAFIPHTK